MSIPFSKIEELIDICKKVNEKEYEEEWDKRIHVLDIAATLQKLIDDEIEEMSKMANQFLEMEDGRDAEEYDEIDVEYYDVNIVERDRADWPHGI